jgi:hypothetical protein
MKTVLLLMVVSIASALSAEPAQRDASSTEHQQWIAKVLKEIQTVQVGMTRQDLLKVFTTEGGISTRRQRTFVHKECPLIKMDVQFRPVGQEDQKLLELPEDAITAISRPYLQWPIAD